GENTWLFRVLIVASRMLGGGGGRAAFLLIGCEFWLVVLGCREYGDAAHGVASSGRGANRAVRGGDWDIELVEDGGGRDRMGVRGARKSSEHARIRGQAVGVDNAEKLGCGHGRRSRQEIVLIAGIEPDFITTRLVGKRRQDRAISLVDDRRRIG